MRDLGEPTMTRTVLAACITLVAICETPAAAQWLKNPTAGVPRKADGTPDPDAPLPRMADGKPDLSGLWQGAERGGSLAGNVGRKMTAGLPVKPATAELLKVRRDNLAKDDPDGYCMPLGVVRMNVYSNPRKIVQVPGLVVILYERDTIFRQIFTDGRALPKDPQPAFYGYSTGKWEGDTLVVTTSGFKDDLWMDDVGSPLTDAAVVTERYRRTSFGSLEIEVTVDDPKAYTKPWTITINHSILLDTDLIEFFCNENNKDVPHLVGK
jgi:hypothetical protein